MSEDRARSGQLAVALLGTGLGAEKHMSPDAIFRAFLAAGIAYAEHAGMSLEDVRVALERIAEQPFFRRDE